MELIILQKKKKNNTEMYRQRRNADNRDKQYENGRSIKQIHSFIVCKQKNRVVVYETFFFANLSNWLQFFFIIRI